MKRRRSKPIVLLWLLPAWLLFGSCGDEPPPAEEVLRPVRTVVAASRSDAISVTYAGVARADTVSELSFRVAGTVEAVSCKLGDRVERGRTLARLDPTDYELQLEEAEASLAQALAALRRADADYERVRALYENDNAAKADLDAVRAAAESARAQTDAGRKRLEQARQQVGYTVLRAPAAGAIARVAVDVNETVAAGQPVVTLEAAGRLEVEVAVPESEIARLREDQPVVVHFDALAGRRVDGTVSEVAIAAAGGSTFPVIVTLEDDEGVRSGMAAEVTFAHQSLGNQGLESRGLENQSDVARIWLPPVAVGEDPEGRHVFVLVAGTDGRGVVSRRPVTIGRVSANGVEIVDGVTAGEIVVTAGVRRLVDGMAVAVLPGQADATGDEAGDAG